MMAGPIQDLCATFFSLFIAFASSDGQSSNNANASTTSQQARKSPLVVGLVAFAVMRYSCMPRLARCISDLTGDCIFLEDAFRQEHRVPLSHCASFEMIKAYLRHHLAGTTAKIFIGIGQFNMTLGRRSGPALLNTDWANDGRIEAHQKVVMSVYLKKGDEKCMQCQSDMKMDDDGRFACYPCGRIYGNCATLRFWAASKAAVLTPATVDPHHAPAPVRPLGPAQILRIIEAVDAAEEEDHFATEGLRNIDFRILRRSCRTRRDPLYNAKPDKNGIYRCPFAQEGCKHCPTKQKCIYA